MKIKDAITVLCAMVSTRHARKDGRIVATASVAEVLCVSRATVQSWKAGRRFPSPHTLAALMRAAGPGAAAARPDAWAVALAFLPANMRRGFYPAPPPAAIPDNVTTGGVDNVNALG